MSCTKTHLNLRLALLRNFRARSKVGQPLHRVNHTVILLQNVCVCVCVCERQRKKEFSKVSFILLDEI